jgi:RNA polymerase primary sigma factor
MQIYFKQIRHYEVLSPEAEKDLLMRIKKGEKAATEILIKHNLKLVIHIANKYKDLGVEIEDLVAEGNIGLCEAVKFYKESKNVKFSSYAAWWIRAYIFGSISNNRNVRLPMNIINQMKKTTGNYEMEKKVRIHDSATEEDEAPGVKLPTRPEIEKNHDNEHFAYLVSKACQGLSDRDKDIVLYHYGVGKEYSISKEDLAEKFGITRVRVNQIIKSTLSRMKLNLT